MGSFRQPQYLSDKDHPTQRVRCPVHGFIHFSENERQIIDHRLFRRLRHIRQLAFTEYVYPGATHTRFEHSLGVMEVATRAFDSLASKRGDLMESTFKEVANFEQEPLGLARQCLRLAAIVHDMGHACFSHAAEETVSKGLGHEALSVEILQREDLLKSKIDALFTNETASSVAQIITGEGLPPQLRFLHDIISGQMDFDRADYLWRDSLHCGVDYGRFDLRRLIETLDLCQDESGTLVIALDRGGIHTFEALILARYQMFTQVYHHRVRRIYDLYLTNYYNALGTQKPHTVEEVLASNDVTMMAQILKDAEREDGDRKKWALRISARHHHRMVFESWLDVGAMELRKWKPLLSAVKEKFPSVEFLDDRAQDKMHKLLKPEDPDTESYTTLYLTEDGTRTGEIGEKSPVIRHVPREFRCLRLYADVDPKDKALREEIEGFARNKWRE